MPRGMPDDSNIVKDGPTWTLFDHAELAARLGSIVTFDRLGTVIDLETFVKGRSRWKEAIFGVGGFVDLTNEHSLHDGVALELCSGTGVTPAVQALWMLPYPELSRLGFEASYAVTGTLHRLYHAMNIFRGAYYDYFALRWNVATGVVEYRDVTAAWIDLGLAIPTPPHSYVFNKVKLVVDPLSGQYERLLINETGLSLRGLYPEQVVAGDTPHIQAWGQVWGDGIANMIAYMDACIITETEPVTP